MGWAPRWCLPFPASPLCQRGSLCGIWVWSAQVSRDREWGEWGEEVRRGESRLRAPGTSRVQDVHIMHSGPCCFSRKHVHRGSGGPSRPRGGSLCSLGKGHWRWGCSLLLLLWFVHIHPAVLLFIPDDRFVLVIWQISFCLPFPSQPAREPGLATLLRLLGLCFGCLYRALHFRSGCQRRRLQGTQAGTPPAGRCFRVLRQP